MCDMALGMQSRLVREVHVSSYQHMRKVLVCTPLTQLYLWINIQEQIEARMVCDTGPSSARLSFMLVATTPLASVQKGIRTA